MAGLTFIKYSLLLLCVSLIDQSVAAAPIKDNEIDYDITVRIDPILRTLEGKSIITVKRPKELRLMLGAPFEVTHAQFNGYPLGMGREQTDQAHVWRIPFDFTPQHQFEIHWRGQLSPLDTTLDHQQTLGRPIAVGSENGTFLPDASAWYPRIVNGLARYKVRLEMPAGQRGLVAGRLVEEKESSENGYEASFEFPFPAEGIDLMAGPYAIETQVFQNIKKRPIQLRTYFHPQLSDLSKDYLHAVQRYLKLYEAWIGEYPFSEFSIVSSPTPTGFGMPTLTYLGINVLQLPFIRDTSLGHEVLHNWWGNGVYPDYSSGNWSEGLTTFMADYTYKELESSEEAREMRLGWLRDFAALQPGQDAPLIAFTSRTHSASKIVGYNKAAMVFFMLRDELGDTMFNRAIQGFWDLQRFKVTSWQQLQRIFELISGQSLEPFFAQWLQRSGAPSLSIHVAKSIPADSSHGLMLTLKQSAPSYRLRVPVAIETQQGTELHWLDLRQEQQTFELALEHPPVWVSLDPDLRLFRQLAPGEAPPILREVMVNPSTQTLLLSDHVDVKKIAELLASKLQDRPLQLMSANQLLSTVPTLIIGLQPEIDAWLAAQQLPSRPDEINAKGTAQAWTLTQSNGATLAVISAKDAAALEALIRPLPHYGRQSYIAFEGRQAIERGIWPMRVQKVKVE